MMILSFVVVSLCDDVRMCGGWGGGVASTSVVQVLFNVYDVRVLCVCVLFVVGYFYWYFFSESEI